MTILSYSQELALVVGYVTHAHPENIAAVALDCIRQLKRDVWAVRVLDAWSKWTGYYWAIDLARPTVTCRLQKPAPLFFDARTPDAARHAAALAVWPTLSAEDKARIGECP